MRTLLASIAAAAALAGSVLPAAAIGVSTPTTYTNLVWSASFTASGLTNCNQLVFDATGDYQNSGSLVVYGALNCATGAYGMTGSLYTAVDDSLSITMLIAGYTVACPRVVNFSGSCTVFDANGVSRGSGQITLQ
ncbi:hypothetical protein HLB44_32945 [Aquincola sp. S2]|uniref:Uncharacterized protein n=1 Tax=Pseudaquabacterium terrae TaxID=2732868 RepID=A0ABX2ETD3_9BURK|nr:hypothetical protein [Aquabacterium terrae]NRF71804.1 hypothetical protein [Aquabacterium terrae]